MNTSIDVLKLLPPAAGSPPAGGSGPTNASAAGKPVRDQVSAVVAVVVSGGVSFDYCQ